MSNCERGEGRVCESTVEELRSEILRARESFRNRPDRYPRSRRTVDISDAYLEGVHNAISESENICRSESLFTTIYRVPPEIYACDRKAYEPKAVCIGPFFYCRRKEQALKSMQDYKWVCVDELVSERDCPKENLLEGCLTKMKEMEACVRSRYSEAFPSFESDEFTLMLMLDGCFLLHLLLRHADSAEKPKDDDDDAGQVVGRLGIWNLVKYDLLLLQNQIPFFVIQSLYDFLKPDDHNICLVDCAINLFSTLDPCRKRKHPKFYIPVDDVHHLLHLIYSSILPYPQYRETCCKQQSPQWIPNATELKGAGIKFKERKNESGFLSFLDIRFCCGAMEIPQLMVHDYSVSLFRNLIAFEQCYPNTQCHLTIYATFMKFLINNEKDVKLLQLKEILMNRMTVNKDATDFFRGLCNEVHYAQGNYIIFDHVAAYYDVPSHRRRADFCRNIKMIWGGLLLLFNAIQSISTFITNISSIVTNITSIIQKVRDLHDN